MKNLFRVLAFVVQCAVLGLAVAFVISLAAPQFATRVRGWFGAPPSAAPGATATTAPAAAGTAANPIVRSAAERAAAERELPAASGPASYAAAVARAAPAVVSITANKVFSTRQVLVPTNPVLQKYFPGIAIGPAMTQHTQSLGSGVIFSTDGYVLTNNHVIQGAEEIQVVLYDGRIRRAGVIGVDADTDLAVLKIDADNLPSIAIADEAPLNVGDVVLAIGNPFGLSRTVTMGIVSALGRQLNMSTYEDFIQTDAAINQGNSGGALINAAGELVGINADIVSPTGGNVGIGFAIPVRTAKAVLDEIVAHGRVIRGWLGAEFADVAALQNPSATRGVAVWKVYPGGPAETGGLRAGDIVLAFNGEPIAGQMELRTREAALAPGSTVELSGLRNGQPFSVQIVLQERPQRQSGA